jgi:UDP-2-acetamido-3-amino-2,3-dideoxy-glucuronate N-acetyltransferase
MEKVIFDFPKIGDERGSLVPLEQMGNIPFEIKRVYYMYDLQYDLARGFHAHKEIKQVLICIKGSCNVLLDDGIQKEEVLLNQSNTGLLIDVLVWHEMYNFSEDCILLVIASDYYNEDDYIRDYKDFLKYIQ